MWVLPLVGYAGLLLGFCLLTLSIASGLYYLSDLVEEYTVFARKCIVLIIYIVIGFQTLLYLVDGFPFLLSALGILSHIVYLGNLQNFPMVRVSDAYFIFSSLLAIINHYLWFAYFSSASPISPTYTPMSRYYSTDIPSFTETSSFFGICVWLVPFALFISLSASDNVLPTMRSEVPTIPGAAGKSKRQAMVKAVLDTARDWIAKLGTLAGWWRQEREFL
ncbi:Protein SVP26 [Erysiphe neolycopersici]|uniref:Protein SVP26 n=1 Tax=Erysiphe neolycopersici TaxID=212602 RepID=A0A420HE44_9PEZI|nr:Protein SVP26 [Erysiphe neolycopersici]